MVRKRRRGQATPTGAGPFTWFNLMLYAVGLTIILTFYWQIGQKTAGCFGVLSETPEVSPTDHSDADGPTKSRIPTEN
ncbi:MAG: hypothetical protein HUU55_04025 [Myxococcales bacterium]|nr:hypothetical protein [Myxococcales bacterium]